MNLHELVDERDIYARRVQEALRTSWPAAETRPALKDPFFPIEYKLYPAQDYWNLMPRDLADQWLNR